MKPIEVSTIQEISDTQYSIIFNKKAKAAAKAKGWEKTDKVLISEDGDSFRIEKLDDEKRAELLKRALG